MNRFEGYIVARRLRHRGQSLVEFTLVLPLLLILALIALDFGRIFLGWVSLQNMARVGANYAALHPHAWDAPGNVNQQAKYQELMQRNGSAINCAPDPSPYPAPGFPEGMEVGDGAVVSLGCRFSVITPIISAVVGQTVRLSASATFPITYGCLAECPPPPASPDPDPPPNNCRVVPDMRGLSVAGARLAWTNAGFDVGNFSPASGDDTSTVASQTVSVPPDAESCQAGQSWFDSSVSVALAPTASPDPTCLIVPNVRGVTVESARNAWTAAGFTGAFAPPPPDHDFKLVVDQVTTPASAPGDCLAPDAAIAVVYEPPPPPPPPPPCQVPSFVNTSSNTAVSSWTAAGFMSDRLTFQSQNRLPYTIRSQSLVGGTWVTCGSSITVGPR